MLGRFSLWGYMSTFFSREKYASTGRTRLIPKMLAKRREIMGARKMGSLALLKEMTPVWDWGFLKVKVKKLVYG